MTKVVLVDLTVLERVLPLAAGYLQAYATRDPGLRSALRFETYSTTVQTPAATIVDRLVAARGDVYGFSCYCWNTRLVRAVLPALRAARPEAWFVLGGPQVEHQGARYLDPGDERLVVCNGEGERTFAELLAAVVGGADPVGVKGLSLFRDGALLTTPEQERIRELDEIPSPFLGELFEKGRYSTALFETSRGCPYGCKYCYWGASTGVARFDEARVRDELEWLSRNSFFYTWIIDGNWGLHPRDLELTRHIARCKRTHGLPRGVYFHAAKKNTERLLQICEELDRAGAVTPLSISFQSLEPRALAAIDRTNMPLEEYATFQAKLHEKGLASHLELIWPLPGETLETFKAGVAKLCELRGDAFYIYPFLLLANTRAAEEREALGIQTRPAPESAGEAEIVVATRDVDRAAYEDGIWFSAAVLVLYSLRYLHAVGDHLHRTGRVTWDQLFSEFADHCRAHLDAPFPALLARRLGEGTHLDFHSLGEIIDYALHSRRRSLERFVHGFVAGRPWWADPEVRARYELDLVNRPYVYIDTAIEPKEHAFEHVRILRVTPDGYDVEVPEPLLCALDRLLERGATLEGAPARRFHVNHRRDQLAEVRVEASGATAVAQNLFYCQEKLHSIRTILPVWTALPARREAGERAAARRAALASDAGDFAF